MKCLEAFVKEYKNSFIKEDIFDDSIVGKIKTVQQQLLSEEFSPSIQLKALFDKLLRRSKYPMEVAIVGQFSSGKSTFLNAILSKDVLPTGITPVTSKVNYINYAPEYKLKVTYHDGTQEYHSLEFISKFTDQRQSVEDIKYLSLYAPLDMLKDISFVDTPGLNSLSTDDTLSTKKILRDVDGIIWLTLIDNAGKESEAEVLQEYLENFKDKSLCVLNQKDKFEVEQIQTSLEYISSKFNEYFSKVIPISAKQALDSRVNQKQMLLDEALSELQQEFKKDSLSFSDNENLEFFEQKYKDYSKKVKEIQAEDKTDDLKLMKESNIQGVIDFIENTIRPQAVDAKAYAIEKDLSSICDILVSEYESILGVYDSLENILHEKDSEMIKAFDDVYLNHSQELFICKEKVETILETVSETIYKNINSFEDVRYEEEKNFLSSKIKSINYDSYKLDKEAVNKELFFESEYIDKQIKATINYLKNIQLQSAEDFRDVFRILKTSVQSWQEPYEFISKHREIASDREFADTRQFVAKVYENILLPYHRATLVNIRLIHEKFVYFEAMFGSSYRHLVMQSMYVVQDKIDKQVQMYKTDTQKYNIRLPEQEEILEVVKNSFSFDKIDTFLSSRRNYLYKIVETSKEQFEEISEDRIDYIVSKKQTIIKKIDRLKIVKKDIYS